jgi:hypothetical protein
MRTDAVRAFACDPAHDLVDGGEVDRRRGKINRPRIEKRHHQGEPVTLALIGKRLAGLPGVPHCPHRAHIVAHPGGDRVVFKPEAARDVPAHLTAKTQREASARKLLERPGRHSRDRRRPRERHGHRRAKSQRSRRRCRWRHHLIGIVLGFLHHQGVEAERLHLAGVRLQRSQIERHFGRTQSRIGLAQREKRLDLHRRTTLNPVARS